MSMMRSLLAEVVVVLAEAGHAPAVRGSAVRLDGAEAIRHAVVTRCDAKVHPDFWVASLQLRLTQVCHDLGAHLSGVSHYLCEDTKERADTRLARAPYRQTRARLSSEHTHEGMWCQVDPRNGGALNARRGA